MVAAVGSPAPPRLRPEEGTTIFGFFVFVCGEEEAEKEDGKEELQEAAEAAATATAATRGRRPQVRGG